tara:strand:- start:1034 stop:1678 length:645 start_codon:yes stop_codon:yes gene_type:complete
MSEEQFKTCNECNEKKHLDDFNFHLTGKLKRNPKCKHCRTKLRKELNYNRPPEGTIVICPHCKEELVESNFNSDKREKNGLQTYCKTCFVIITKTGRSNYEGFILNLYKDLKENAKKRNIRVEIDIDDIKKMYKEQDGNCYLSGIKLTYTKLGVTKNNISVDRVDSEGHYTIDNCKLCTVIVNKLKGNMDVEEFKQLAKKVIDYRISKGLLKLN